MKIALVVTRSDVYGGAVVHVRDLAVGLLQRGHQVAVHIGGDGPMIDHLRAAGIDTRPVPHLRRPLDPDSDGRALSQLLASLRDDRPDLLHAHTAKAGLLGRIAARRLGLPAVYTPHAWPFLDGVPAAARALYLRVERAAARLPARLIDVCDYERDFALGVGVGAERHHTVIVNGVADVPDALRADPGVNPPVLVDVARFEPQKDHATLLAALSGLTELPWTLELIGDGRGRADAESMAARLDIADRVRFVGEVDDVERRLAGAQGLVLTSNWEAMPLVILEAMRAGLPVVATAVGGVPEAVADGISGALVERGDVDGLRTRLREIIASPSARVRMGAQGRARYLRRFTLDRMVDETASLYERVVATPAPAPLPAATGHLRPLAGRILAPARNAARRATSGHRPLPDFLIIGTQKGGTTSLFRYMERHPRIAPAVGKEVHYFDLQYDRGIEWYRSRFPVRGRSGDVAGEASPYYLFHPLVPERAARDLPEVRLIVVLRDPVARAYSHYHHEVANGREHLSFEAALDAEADRVDARIEDLVRGGGTSLNHQRYSYLARGRYVEQLEAWFAAVDRERCLILRSEDLYARPAETLTRVFGFLGLPDHVTDDFPRHNTGVANAPMAAATRRDLQAYFAPHNRRLRGLAGTHLCWEDRGRDLGSDDQHDKEQAWTASST
jgi:glycosyltransferase involved in cell wall biosynthesis